ncbi:MAG: hypothetical protein QOH74_1469 [Gaiellales bacterium]|jgi:hypothetical protein|nr:hypothetical protein [Gaiellales bacterium]
MQITVACHRCDHPKRPLSPCPHCSAASFAEAELQAWRLSLHSRHLARIKATPRIAELPARESISSGPMQVVLTLDVAPEAPVATVTQIVPHEPPINADDALSFDWNDEQRRPYRLRRSA